MDFAANNYLMFREFANATVNFTLNGVAVKSDVRAILDEKVEVFSPGQTNMTEFKPAITVASADLQNIDQSHLAHVVPDPNWQGTLREGDFKFYGPPEPDGQGFTFIILVAKK